jgi:hypothetical protein
MDCYEDMFKEITRKLYGTEDGLSTTASANNPSNTSPVTTNSSSMEQRPSGTNGQRYEEQQQQQQPLPPPFLKEETLTAFGLAALMQTSFPPAAAAMSGYTPQGHHYPHQLSVSPSGQSQSQLHQNHLPINIPPPPQPAQQAPEPAGHVDRSVFFKFQFLKMNVQICN